MTTASATGGPVLVTGGAGFIGSNIAHRLASDGHEVLILDGLNRPGVERNLEWLKAEHPGKIEHVLADIRDEDAVNAAVNQAKAVFHMAAQVAVTTSMVDPVEDFEVNIRGTLSVLEAARRGGRRTPVIFASTNKVYGDLAGLELERVDDAYHPADAQMRACGVNENWPLDFHTPYGCSKGAADQYVLDYARSYDLPSCVFRMSCIYGPRQMGTEDQGWVAHFLIRALQGQPITLYGDGRQVRDILFVDDCVDAYMAAWKQIESVSGQAFNMGGGRSNAVSLRQLIGHLETVIGRSIEVTYDDWRAGDQRYFVADARLARRRLGLSEPLDWRTGVQRLADWLQAQRASAGKAVAEAVS